MQNNFDELNTKGFTVFKNFFDENDRKVLLDIYQEKKISGEFLARYKIMTSSPPLEIRSKIECLLSSITDSTDITVNTAQNLVAYYDTENGSWEWHQDLEPYLIFQDSFNSLNFWFPLVKPSADKSGLSLIPVNKFIEQVPEEYKDRFFRRGAKSFSPLKKSSGVLVTDHYSGDNYILNVNLRNLEETPDVSPGDIVAFRYDVIHRTQTDRSNDRIAGSIRCYDSNGKITRDFFSVTGSPEMQDSLSKFQIFDRIKQMFVDRQCDQLKISDIIKK